MLIIDILSVLGSAATLDTWVRDAIKKAASNQTNNEIKSLYDDVDFSSLDGELADCADKVVHYISVTKDGLTSKKLFTEEERKLFFEDFINNHNDLIPNRIYVERLLTKLLNRLEQAILNQMTYGDRVLYSQGKLILRQNEVIAKQNETLLRQGETTQKLLAKRPGGFDVPYPQEQNEPHTANKLYDESFRKVMFLHGKKDTKVTLANLFVMQKYTEFDFEKGEEIAHPPELPQRLATFIYEEYRTFLFIEGDAGSGKTSLISWLNYHYKENDDTAKQVLGDRPLVTIRLRDLKKNLISKTNSLVPAILDYLHLGSIDNLEEAFPNAVLVLDGFDELCLIDKVSDYEELLYDLNRKHLKNYKYIVTSRPRYVGRIDVPHRFITLKHFDQELRLEWLKRYTDPKYCGQSISPKVRRFIENIKDDDPSGIFDTPMTLYMVVAKKLDIDKDYNIWELYHQIFYNEVSETEYNKMFPDPNRDYQHSIIRHRDIIHRISEEIAYRIYQTQNMRLFISSDELKDIIDKLSEEDETLKNAKIRQMVERCYALCSFWKANSDTGMIEFYHNNIRDFFLCEKIFRELNRIYNGIKTNPNLANQNDYAAKELCNMFYFSVLETTVSKFILFRSIYDKKHNKREFPYWEHEQKLLPEIFEILLRYGIVYNLEKSLNPIQHIISVLTCVAQIFRYSYEPYLNKDETIHWWKQCFSVKKAGMFDHVFRSVFCQFPVILDNGEIITLASRGYFTGTDFSSLDLRNIGFQNSVIYDANFENAILCGCDFTNTVLVGSNFANADIHYAKLLGASLVKCNFTGTLLRGTDLPDEYCENDEDKQVQHLKSLNIPGLKI